MATSVAKAKDALKRLMCSKYRAVGPLTGALTMRDSVSARSRERTAFETV